MAIEPIPTPTPTPTPLPVITPSPGVAASPTVTPVPGVGTLTTTPKAIPGLEGGAPLVNGQDPNIGGLYARTGVPAPSPLTAATPAQATNANNGVYKDANNNVFKADGTPIDQATFQSMGLNIDHINTKDNIAPPAQAPVFGAADPTTSPVIKAYQDLSKQLGDISASILANATATPEEKALAEELNTKKAALDSFDLETMKRAEAYSGQGRGQTTSFVAQNVTQDARTRALQRLGFAQDVSNDTNQLALLQKNRADLTDAEKTEYDLAGKQVDIALNVSKEMDRLDTEHQDKARQYLLDVIDFSKGKSWDELDQATQAQIIASVANSPITLGMVKSALENSSSKLTYETRDVGGRTIRFGFDDKGNTVSKTDLGASSSGGGTTDIFGDANKIIAQYKAANIDRAAIEKQYSDAGKAIPPEVQKALDDVYGKTVAPTQHWGGWINPMNW